MYLQACGSVSGTQCNSTQCNTLNKDIKPEPQKDLPLVSSMIENIIQVMKA